GWQLAAVVDQATGQVALDLYSATPIRSTAGGSLVTLTFHVTGAGVAGFNLAGAVTPYGGPAFRTELDDDQGAFVLHPAPTDAAGEPGIDGLVVLPGADPVLTASPGPVSPMSGNV